MTTRICIVLSFILLAGCKVEEATPSEPTSRLRINAGVGAVPMGMRTIRLSGQTSANDIPSLRNGDTVECDRDARILQQPGSPVFVLQSLEGVTLRGCRIEGLGVVEEELRHSTGPSENIILVENSSNILIEDMTLQNVRGEAGIRVHNSRSITVDGVVIRDFSHRGIEIMGASRDVTLLGNVITKSESMVAEFASRRPAEVGIEISAGLDEPFPQGVNVEGNSCRNLIHGSCYSARGGNLLKFIENEAFNSIQCFSFNLRATRPAHGLSNLQVIGNNCVTVADDRSGQRYPVRVNGDIQRDASGEVVYEYRQEGWGIRVGGSHRMTSNGLETVPARHITLSNNRVFSAAVLGELKDQKPGIGVQYALNVQIIDNDISSSGQNGVSLVYVDSFSIYGNRIRSSGYAGIFLGVGNTLSTMGSNYRDENVIEKNRIGEPNPQISDSTLWGISVARGVTSVGPLREGANQICLNANPDHQYQSNDYPEIEETLTLESCE